MKHSGEHIHLISFDVPFPADYGGVIDVFYKIKAKYLWLPIGNLYNYNI